MKFLSPAKLNLNLRVISKRIDGYHNLETTFQFIDLFDEITFEKSNESFNVSCDGLEIEPENNLIFKSFNAIKEYCDCLLYTSPSPRDLSTSRMPSSA